MMSAVQLVAKRVVNYIVRRFFGPYLETFTHDELSIDYNKGKAVVENVALRVEPLNALLKEYNLPFELLNGVIASVSFEIPWTAILQESTVIEFRGISLVVQPIKCAEDDGESRFTGSMFSSMFESMASSQQMAEECIAYEFEAEMGTHEQVDSVETIVQAIETVFSNMKIKFFDTEIRVESVLDDNITGVALEIEIQSVTCFDEASMESAPITNRNNNPDRNSAYSIKRCIVEGISLFTAQFAASEHNSNQEYSSTMLSPGSPEMPPQHASLLSQKEDKVLQIEPVLISKITGQQQLRLKLKQDDSAIGPKADIELSLGSFNLFLSPYQVFMLIELANGLVKPGNVKNSDTYRQPINNRPMRETDYALIEQELLKEREKRNLPSQSLQNQCGWSSHALDESDEEFHLMKVEGKTTEVPLIAEDLESSCSSIGSERLTACSSSSSEATGYRKSLKPRGSIIQTILTDPLTESLQVHLSCSTFSIVLLHDHRSTEEPLNLDHNFSNNSLNFKSLGIIAQKYFEDLAMLSMEGLNFKDFDAIRVKVSKLTKANHLRFVASGVTLEANEKKSSLRRALTTLLSVLDLEVLECLFNESDENPSKEPSHMQIVSFNHEHLPLNNASSGKEACLKVKYNQYHCGVQLRTDPETVTDKLEFVMAPVALDVDISLTNRIQSLLNPDLTFIRRSKKQEPFVYNWRDETTMSSHFSPKLEVHFSAPFVLLNLRFPIPDLRPYIDRLPWWKQHLRKESLVMELTDASLSFIFEPEQTKQKIELQCKDFHGLLQVSPNERVSFIRVSLDPEVEKTHHDEGFDWPRLVIYKVPQMNVLCMDPQLQDDDAYNSIQEVTVQSLIANMKQDPSPFTNIPVTFGSKLSSPSKDSKMSTDEVIKPAEKEKMDTFIANIVDRSQYVFDFCLPRVNIVLPDKKFFELLYNRLSSDLLLWENTLMVPLSSHDTNMSSAIELNMQPLRDNASLMSFKSCSDADSESDDDDAFTFQSVQGQSLHTLKKSEAKLDSADNHKLTKLSIIMTINKGSATIHSPYKDSHGNISSDACGRIQLCVENSKFFIASSYKGKPNESYICFLANRGHLYHDGVAPFPSPNFIVPQFVSRPEKSSNMIVYPSESEASITPEVVIGKGRESIDILSIAAYAVTNAKQQTKTFKIAIGVSGSTLRHYMCPSAELWFNQFSDFLKVEDYPLYGYKPPSVMIELHLHLMNCAIDYRPLHLPLKTFMTLESFNLSTNISATTKSSLLRMISEELSLFLSNNMKTSAVHLKNNYVCVLNTGLIVLSVRVTGSCDVTDDTNQTSGPEVQPKLEMCAMNNMINIYTCSDSCQALQKLIVYLATYGDFISTATSPDENPDIANVIKEEKTPSCAQSSPPKNVRSLVVEAMEDYSSAKQSSEKDQSDTEHNDSDESFCIIEDEVGVGVPPKNKEPKIRILTDQPIKIVEDYFKPPSGKTDILKAPKCFPEPNLCQTLNEMSVTWHLYGGNDFPLAKEPEKKRVRYSSCPESKDRSNLNLKQSEIQKVHINTERDTASFCKITTSKDTNAETVHCSMEQISLSDVGQEGDPKSWIVKGGKDRDHSVLIELQLNKVQIKHEEYPKDTKYVSRNVLVIHDIQIRDKLADSSFNKFLYWYSSESLPRQSHANMFKVKTLTAYSDPTHQREECNLIVSCQPLRLNIDQDALMFLYNFFKPFFEEASCDGQEQEKYPGPNLKSSPPTEEQPLPVMSQQGSDASPIYFKSFSFSEKVLIRFDYKGKRVVMEKGAIQGLLMGFAQLNGSEITLKKLYHRHGLLGWERLLAYAFNEWYEDIKSHQLHGLISGLGPINAFFQLFQGIKDFVWCPVVQYRKDGQIVRGLQRGALSLSTSTAAAVLELTSQFVGLIQNVAVYAYDVVSPGPSVTNRLQGNINESRWQSQPADIREGVVSACDIITEGISDAVRTVVRDATIEHEHKGVPGAVGAVVRQIPSTVITPLFVSTQATKSMLHGAKHQLLPDAHKEAKDKWRTWNK